MKKQKYVLEWTGYASDDEVKEYMELHNADEVGEGDNAWSFEDAQYHMSLDDYWYYRWEDFTEYLTELMNKNNYWVDRAKNMGWRNLQGSKVFESENGKDFLRNISPNCDCTYYIRKYYKGFKIRISHHDSPMGETHIVMPLSEKAYNKLNDE